MQNTQQARRSSAGTSDVDMRDVPGSPGLRRDSRGRSMSRPSEASAEAEAYNVSHFFVVDSFNIHRLVIAGVTCASKFFSDVFYTNSRYAKVCERFLPWIVELIMSRLADFLFQN